MIISGVIFFPQIFTQIIYKIFSSVFSKKCGTRSACQERAGVRSYNIVFAQILVSSNDINFFLWFEQGEKQGHKIQQRNSHRENVAVPGKKRRLLPQGQFMRQSFSLKNRRCFDGSPIRIDEH